MPFCPKCGTEYVDDVLKCSDCQVMLVEKLNTDLSDTNYVDWVPIYNLPGAVYAEMVKEVLDQRGIPCFVSNDLIPSAFSAKGISTVGGDSKLYVPQEFKEAALNILHQMVDHI